MENDKKLVQFLEIGFKHAGMNVPCPAPCLEKMAMEKMRDYDAWTNVQIALNGVSDEDGQTIARLLIHKYYPVLDALTVNRTLAEETKITVDYVKDHEEFKQRPGGDMMEDLFKMFEDG